MSYHVLPIDDLKVHVMVLKCWCHPTLSPATTIGETVIIHNSADGREAQELRDELYLEN